MMNDDDIKVVYGIYNLGEEREMARHSLGYILDDFADIKKRYISLGFHLEEFKRCKYYTDFGYLTFTDFCDENIPLDKGSISRCISVYQMFSEYDKTSNSRKMWIDDKYKDYSYSQLVEMLSFGTEVIRLIPPDMSVSKIRNLKKFVSSVKYYDSGDMIRIREYIEAGCPAPDKIKSCDVATVNVEPAYIAMSENTPLFTADKFIEDSFLKELFTKIQLVLSTLCLDVDDFERKGRKLLFKDLDNNEYSIIFQIHKKNEVKKEG